ncbi:MAG TPA: phenylalanine--tRNA ligase subunit beta [Candidatus Paceibacterota bacterium]
MKISYAWLQTYFADKLPDPEKLGELFNAHAFELEGMEKAALDGVADADSVLDLKILPDRSHYALCHAGIAREASVIAKMPLKASVEPEIAPDKTVAEVLVHVTDSKLCPRYMARRVDGVAGADSPAWLSERLTAIGARSINAIVDATNFVMFDMGQPLHAFDADKVQGVITVRKAMAGEKITILDGREIELKESDLVIADTLGALAIAGVKGGKRAEVTKSTKNIIIEAANFNPTTVRRTATRTNLRNDSSKRFENEITPDLASRALDQVTALILELSKDAGANAVSPAKAGIATDIYPAPARPWTVTVPVSYISSMVGMPVSQAEVEDILKRQGCEVSVSGDMLSVTPPLDRLDMIITEDVSDEIARIKGYGELVGVQTPDIAPVAIDSTFYWSEKVKSVLVSAGFSEMILYVLVPKGAFEVTYPLASDKSALRERLSPKLSQALVDNARNADLLGLETIRMCEIGRVFPKTGEKTSICIGVSQVKKKKGVTSESVLKDAVANLEAALAVSLDAKIEVGQFGAIIEADFDALVTKLSAKNGAQSASLKDLDFKALPKDKKYVPFSHYPFISRDIALFVPATVNGEEVAATIKAAAQSAASELLVKGPDMFDAFTKDGKTSYAFRMIFQSFSKTLSDDEVNAFMQAIYAAVKAKGWEVR